MASKRADCKCPFACAAAISRAIRADNSHIFYV
jgi:hypothetical protein